MYRVGVWIYSNLLICRIETAGKGQGLKTLPFVCYVVKQSPKVHAAPTDSRPAIITANSKQSRQTGADSVGYYINLLYEVERGAAGDAEARESPSENAKKEKSGLTIDFCVKISVKAC